MKIAVIDVGSNSIRLGIYNGGLKEVLSRRISTRLAEGLNENNRLQADAVKRSVKAFEEFKALLDEEGVENITAVATESLRRAENGGDFIAEVYEKTGIKTDIINGAEECRYGAYAAMSSAGIKDFYVLDTGGGSVELTLVKNGEVESFVCLPMGCVVLTDRFSPDTCGCGKMNEYIDGEFEKYSWICESLPVVVMGGSNKMIGKIMLKTDDDSIIDGSSVSAEEIYCTAERIISLSREERSEIAYMEQTRVDIITAGLAPLMRLCKAVNPQEVIFCSKSIREGVAAKIICGSL